MTDGEVRYARDGEVAIVIFDRPAARNAMTWRMYEQLGEACAQIRREDGPGSRLGVPIARTLGNCLSIANYARLVAALGASRAKRMLLLAENLSAEEALAAGFLSEIVEAGELDRRVGELCSRLAQHAPITMRVSKEAISRLLHAGLPDGDDLVRACYGSDDFRLGVEAFVDKRQPRWTGK